MAGAYTEADVRIRRAERAQYPREHVRAHRGCGGDEQRANVALPQVRDELAPLVDGRDRPLGVGEERAAGVAQLHPAPGAHEELDP